MPYLVPDTLDVFNNPVINVEDVDLLGFDPATNAAQGGNAVNVRSLVDYVGTALENVDLGDLQAQVNGIRTDLDDEVTRATNAEGDLGTRITTEVGAVTTALNTAIAQGEDEHDVRVAEEARIEGLITQEVIDRGNAVSGEAAARAAADDANAAAITGVANDVTALTDRVAAEEANTAGEAGRIAAAVAGEAAARTAGDATLDTRITDEVDALSQIITALGDTYDGRINDLWDEAADIRADFAAADVGLGQRITDEATARTTAITGVAASVTAEVTARTNADTALGTRIDDEAAARGTAIDTVTAAVTAERNRAIGVEDGLDGRIDALEAVDNFTQAEFDAFNADLTQTLDLKADLVDGIIPVGQIPQIALIQPRAVADTAALYALDAQEGDLVIVNGVGTFVRNNTDPAGTGGAVTDATNWFEIIAPAGGANASDLAAEVARATAAEGVLRGRVTTLEGVDNFTQAEADTERTARLAAEAALGGRVDTEATARAAGDTTNANAIAAEVTARTTGDQTNADAITAEATRATAAEGVLSGRITTEVNDRTAAITAEATTRAAADTANANAVAAEATARADGDQANADAITAEATTRATAITSVRTDFAAADAVVTAAVTAETTRATGVEAGLRTDLNAALALGATEHTERVAAETTLQTNIDAEASRAGAAETALGGRVDTEAAARAAADTAEATARAAGDATLTTALGVLNGNATTVGSVAYAVAAEAAARTTAVNAVSAAVTQEATDRANADSTLQGNITAEATARTNADTAIRTDFAAADNAVRGEFAAADAAEVTARTAAINTLTTNLGTEVTNRTNADANLQTQIDNLVTNAYDDTALRGRVTTLEGEVSTLNGTGAGSVQSTADARISAQKGVANGLATLDANGKVPLTQISATTAISVTVVDNIAARDAATAQEGDVIIVRDNGNGVRQAFIMTADGWSNFSDPADVTEAELGAAVDNALTALRGGYAGSLQDIVDDYTARVDGLVAGAGLTRTGDTFNVGAGTGITVNADSVQISATYAGQTSITTVGTVTTGTWEGDVIAAEFLDVPGDVARRWVGTMNVATDTSGATATLTHNLGYRPTVAVYRDADGVMVHPGVTSTATTTTVTFGNVGTGNAGTYEVVVVA